MADPVNGPVVANLLGIVYHFPNTTVAYAPLENEVGIRQCRPINPQVRQMFADVNPVLVSSRILPFLRLAAQKSFCSFSFPGIFPEVRCEIPSIFRHLNHIVLVTSLVLC